MVGKVLAKISTRIYLEHQTNKIRATILYTFIGAMAGMLLVWLQMALQMQRDGNTKKVVLCPLFFPVKNESILYISEPSNLRRIAKLYVIKPETECVTPSQKGPRLWTRFYLQTAVDLYRYFCACNAGP